MKTTNYKLQLLNKLLCLPFVAVYRLALLGWTTLTTMGDYTVFAYRLVFNRRNAARVRKCWRAYRELQEDAGDWIIDKVFFKGRVGLVYFNLMEDDVPDGYLVVRQYGEEQRTVEVGYRVENRWLVSRGALPSGYVISSIRTQAIEQGFKVAHIKWGHKLLMPYHVPRLSLLRRPDDVSIPCEELWTEVQKFPQYEGDPLAKHSSILARC